MADKLRIRLPEDDQHGPNPYDSKTKPEDLPGNQWLVSWQWWLTIVVAAIVMSIGTWWRTKG